MKPNCQGTFEAKTSYIVFAFDLIEVSETVFSNVDVYTNRPIATDCVHAVTEFEFERS